MKAEQYYIQAEGESKLEAKETHAEFYDSVKEAMDDAQLNGPTGMDFNVRRVSDDKLMKKGTVRCLN